MVILGIAAKSVKLGALLCFFACLLGSRDHIGSDLRKSEIEIM